MPMLNLKQKNKTPLIIAASLLVILLITGAGVLAYTQKWWPFAETNYIIDGINYGPPTEEEIENSQNAKKDLLNNDKALNNNSDTKNPQKLKEVSVGVSHSDIVDGSVEVRAFIAGVVEGTGTCTATFSYSSSASLVRKSSKAFVDASTSQCKPILIPLSEFQKTGKWTLIVSYNSPTSHGESEKLTVNI